MDFITLWQTMDQWAIDNLELIAVAITAFFLGAIVMLLLDWDKGDGQQ